MRTDTYACDRCGRPATVQARIFAHEIKASEPYDLTQLDLCAECAAQLRSWADKREDSPWQSQGTTRWDG